MNIGNGWGFQSSQFAATQVVGAANAVIPNSGIGRSVIAGGSIRLAKLTYRIDLAPDVGAGSVVSPIYWRVVVLGGSGQLPADLSAFQQQAFPAGSHPEIPTLIGISSPIPILHDIWLDLSAGDPGLNRLAELEFTDAGPTVGKGDTLSVLVLPIIDANLAAAPLAAANVMVSLGVYGTGVDVNPLGSPSGYGGQDSSRSLPRFDVALIGSGQ